MSPEQKEKIIKLLENNRFGVIATYPTELDRAPESAVVAISYTLNLEIVFGSFNTTRKNKNLERNSKISIVVGWDNTLKQTLQMEGEAFKILGAERIKLEEAHCQRNIESNHFRNDQRQEYFKIKPYWIRYSDFSKDPQEVWENTL